MTETKKLREQVTAMIGNEQFAVIEPSELKEILDRLEAAEKDAARYRHWRELHIKQLMLVALNCARTPAEIDAAFDAAIDQSEQPLEMVDSDGSQHAMWPATDERMDVIGQNGNTGDHYGNQNTQS